jgi:hypothetical protein
LGAFFLVHMAIKTYVEQLESVQAAIAAIESGAQSFQLPDGQAVTKGDLATLYAREQRLMPLATREAAGRTGPRVRYVEVG